MKTELERCKEAVAVARKGLSDLCGADNRTFTSRRGKEALQQIDAILNPPPEMEEVEVISWANFTLDGRLYHSGLSQAEAESYTTCDLRAVKLTGTYKRPKPQPVEKSIPVTLRADGRWVSSGPAKIALKIGEQQEGRFVWTEPAE